MKTYRYTLERYKGSNTRYCCPQCNHKGAFVRYIDTRTGQHLADDIGRCNRELQCGYHKKPSSEVKNEKEKRKSPPLLQPKSTNQQINQSTNQQTNRSTSQLTTLFQNSLCCYPTNGLAQYIYRTYGWQAMEHVFDAYRIGSHTDGSTIFWQVDAQHCIRGGKVIRYDAHTGHRIKSTDTPPVRWVHSLHRLQGYTLQQCFFGEHLLSGNTLPVAIAESEKTAVIAAIRMPQYIWLATGGIRNLSAEKCSVLKGRHIILFPDAGAWDCWNTIAATIPQCSVSTVLQHHTDGSDIADYLLIG